MSVERRIYIIKRPNSFVSEAPKRNGIVVFDAIPANVRSDDIMFASPSGQIRNHEYLKWYQRGCGWRLKRKFAVGSELYKIFCYETKYLRPFSVFGGRVFHCSRFNNCNCGYCFGDKR